MLLHQLSPFDAHGSLRTVVETPRGGTVKLNYEQETGLFVASRSLPLGISYPYDWGFIPGTRAEDGDPIDVLIIHDGLTYPGVVVQCKILGMILVTQTDRKKKGIVNNRVIARPLWNKRMGDVSSQKDLPYQTRAEIESFFLNTTFFTPKNPVIKGWVGPARSNAYIRANIAPT